MDELMIGGDHESKSKKKYLKFLEDKNKIIHEEIKILNTQLDS